MGCRGLQLNSYFSFVGDDKPESPFPRGNRDYKSIAEGFIITDYVDASGTVQAHYEYSPFGKIAKSNGAMEDDFDYRFSSEVYDSEAGLVYYNYRYYSAELGRWLSRDPIEEDGGYNLYAMVGNDAVGGWDWLGLDEAVLKMHLRATVAADPNCGDIDGISKDFHLQTKYVAVDVDFTVKVEYDNDSGKILSINLASKDARDKVHKFLVNRIIAAGKQYKGVRDRVYTAGGKNKTGAYSNLIFNDVNAKIVITVTLTKTWEECKKKGDKTECYKPYYVVTAILDGAIVGSFTYSLTPLNGSKRGVTIKNQKGSISRDIIMSGPTATSPPLRPKDAKCTPSDGIPDDVEVDEDTKALERKMKHAGGKKVLH